MGGLVPRIFRTTTAIYSDQVVQMASNIDTLCVMDRGSALKCFGAGALGKRAELATIREASSEGQDGGMAVKAV